jgi:hypothetical protein
LGPVPVVDSDAEQATDAGEEQLVLVAADRARISGHGSGFAAATTRGKSERVQLRDPQRCAHYAGQVLELAGHLGDPVVREQQAEPADHVQGCTHTRPAAESPK